MSFGPSLISTRTQAAVALMATAAFLAPSSVAAPPTDRPRVWTYDPPVGVAAESGVFKPLVRVAAWSYLSPTAVADQACDFILAQGLGPGEVAFLPYAFGRGSIFGHPLDNLASPPAPPGLTAAPWTVNGRAEARQWTQQFIARYQQRAAAQGLPAPTRWHMDCEFRLPALCYPPSLDSCWGTEPLAYFAALQSDPRWNTEPLLMNPGGVPALRTLAQLYAAAGSPSYDLTVPRDAPANRAWSRWWDSVHREAMEGAMKDAFYTVVQAEWPQSLTSEFASSMRLDGGVEPDGSLREFVDFEWWDRGWMRSRFDGHGDLQAPTMFLFGTSFLDPTRDFWSENLRLHRANLDACLHSYGGVAPTQVTPWVCMPDILLPDGTGPNGARAISRDEFVSMMALLRGRGIAEFVTFPGVSEATWNAAARAVDAAWGTELQSASIFRGSGTGSPSALLRRADRQALVVRPIKQQAAVNARFIAPPRDGCSSDGRFWVAIEMSAPAGGTATVSAIAPGGGTVALASFTIPAGVPTAQWLGPFSAAGRVAPSGELDLRVSAAVGSSVARFDLVQAVVERARTPDIDRDGTVQAGDLARLLAGWAGSDAQADLDGDGVVASTDLAILLGAWGACP